MTTIGIVSPGAMGSGLGRCWQAGGHRVVATVEGRSPRTRALAEGLELLASLDDVIAASDLVVSVCPPGQAETVLDTILDAASRTGCTPLITDANALSPGLVRLLAARADATSCEFVDAAVSGGPPPGPSGSTMVYLSGPGASRVAELPVEGFRTQVVGPGVGTASAVKMCTASVYKGTHALWLQALETAAALGVTDLVLTDLAEEFPQLAAGAARSIATAASKSARFVAEMEQISATQGEAGASPELFAGVAAVYRRVAGTELAAATPEHAREEADLRSVLRRLAPQAGAGHG